MSTNFVSDDLINFLLAAAMSCGRRMETPGEPAFTWTRRNGDMEELTPDSVQRTGRMLREENVKAVVRHLERGDPLAEPPDTSFRTERLVPVGQPRPAEVMKAADYYEYQSSQHPGWAESDAREFIECLRAATWMGTPEYRRAAWGVPPHARSYYRAVPEPEGRVETNPAADRSRVRLMGG